MAAGAMSGAMRGSRDRAMGYEPGRVRAAEGAIAVAVPQVRGASEPFRSSLMSFLDGSSEVLERLVTEMYARGLFTPRCRGCLPRCDRRGAHLQIGGLGDHRASLGGLLGLHHPKPLRDQGEVRVCRCGV
jgi:hypothetical protein